MSAFFANMNLARAIILLSLVGSVFLGWTGWNGLPWFGWTGRRELRELQESLQQQVPDVVGEIQQLSEVHTKLMRDKDGDQFLRQQSPEFYIRGIGDRFELGQITLDPKSDIPSKGIVDQKYRIIPDRKDAAYSRGQIGQFLYYLEADSRRVRVTDVKIDLLDTKTKPHEVPRDAWSFEAEVTSRQKEKEAGQS